MRRVGGYGILGGLCHYLIFNPRNQWLAALAFILNVALDVVFRKQLDHGIKAPAWQANVVWKVFCASDDPGLVPDR